jgi:hypothetical protein
MLPDPAKYEKPRTFFFAIANRIVKLFGSEPDVYISEKSFMQICKEIDTTTDLMKLLKLCKEIDKYIQQFELEYSMFHKTLKLLKVTAEYGFYIRSEEKRQSGDKRCVNKGRKSWWELMRKHNHTALYKKDTWKFMNSIRKANGIKLKPKSK